MKIKELLKGQQVVDAWWPEHMGTVVAVYKKSIHILYPTRDDKWIYDEEHAEQFLRFIK